MFPLALVAAALIVLIVLAQFSGVLAVLWFVAAVVVIPAVVIQRREMQSQPEFGDDAEHMGWGFFRLAGTLSIDATGIALGVILLLGGVFLIYLLSGGSPHVGH